MCKHSLFDGEQYNGSCYLPASSQLQVTGDNMMLLVIADGITGELTAASEGSNTMLMGGNTGELSFKWPAASDRRQYNASCYRRWHYW
jgi:hypothetical protein